MATAIETPEADVQEQTEAETKFPKAEQFHYAEIRAMERKVGGLLSAAEVDKTEASISKKLFEKADEELRALIHRGPDPQLILPGMEPVAEAQDPSGVLIGEIGLTEKQIENFAEAGVKSIGEFNALLETHGDRWWDHVKGIGEKAAEKISDLFIKFWEIHPEYCGPFNGTVEKIPTKIRLLHIVPNLGSVDQEFLAGEQFDEFRVVDGQPVFACQGMMDGEKTKLDPEDYEVLESETAVREEGQVESD